MKIEIRNDSVLIEGYVNAVGRDSRPITGKDGKCFVEQIVPGAFQRAIDKADEIKVLLDHEKEIGSTKTGAVIYEDAIGLRARVETSDAETIHKARKGLLRGWSFGFIRPKERRVENKEGLERRMIEDMEIKEVSVIDDKKIPCYEATSIETRADEEDHRLIEFRAEIIDLRHKETVDYKIRNSLLRAMI